MRETTKRATAWVSGLVLGVCVLAALAVNCRHVRAADPARGGAPVCLFGLKVSDTVTVPLYGNLALTEFAGTAEDANATYEVTWRPLVREDVATDFGVVTFYYDYLVLKVTWKAGAVAATEWAYSGASIPPTDGVAEYPLTHGETGRRKVQMIYP